MSRIKITSKKKVAVLLVVLALLTSGTAYAAYKILDFQYDGQISKNITNLSQKIKDLTTSLNSTADSLKTEKNNHNTDVNNANQQISSANAYVSSVSNALSSTTVDTKAADDAISKASSASSYDPTSTSSSK